MITRSILAALLLLSALASTEALASPITKTLTVNVYQVCMTDGSDCAATGPGDPSQEFFAASTAKIWAQAGISVFYNLVGTINNSLFANIDDGVAGRTFDDLAHVGGNYLSSTMVDMFLVHTIAGAYGEGWIGAGGLAVAMDTILAFAPGGRIDTMAHELGHNLGLDVAPDPNADGNGHSNDPNQLMASGGIRNIPLTLSDINPDGLGYDQLSENQIEVARRSSLLRDIDVAAVPEPAPFAISFVGLMLLLVFRQARRRPNPMAMSSV